MLFRPPPRRFVLPIFALGAFGCDCLGRGTREELSGVASRSVVAFAYVKYSIASSLCLGAPAYCRAENASGNAVQPELSDPSEVPACCDHQKAIHGLPRLKHHPSAPDFLKKHRPRQRACRLFFASQSCEAFYFFQPRLALPYITMRGSYFCACLEAL